MSDTLGHEFAPGQVTTGVHLNPQGIMTPTQRPTFASAFLQNLGPALGAGLATNIKTGAAGAFGGALQGVQENQRYQQQEGAQQQAAKRQAGLDQLNAQNIQSEMEDRATQARLRLAQATKAVTPAAPTDEFQLWQSQHQGEPAENFWKAKQAAMPVKPDKAPTTPFEVWAAQQGPNPDVSKWLKLQADNKPASGANQADTRLDKSYQFNATQLEKLRTPIDASVDRLARLNDSISQKTPQADAFLAPELLSVMAGGQGSGLRMNESEISRIIGGATKATQLKTALNKWSLDPNHATFTDDQRNQMRTLMQAVQSRVQQKQSILNDAQQNLVEATDVTKHRQIIADTQKKLMQIDSGNYSPTVQGMKLPPGFALETH